MDPITLGLVTGIPAALKTGTGVFQWLEGRKAQKNAVRPTREIPPEVFENLSQSQIMALEGMPEAQRNAFLQDIQRSTQSGMRRLQDRKSGIAGVSSLHQNELDALNRLSGQDAMMRRQNQQGLMQSRNEVSRQRDMQFDINEYRPFLDKMRMAEGMIGAGMQNALGGVNDASRMLVDYDLFSQSMGGDGFNPRLGGGNQNNNPQQINFQGNMNDNLPFSSRGIEPEYNFNELFPPNMNNQTPNWNW